MKKVSIGLLVGLVFASVFAGSFVSKSASSGHQVFAILPNCLPEKADTIGPIPLNYAKTYSLSFSGDRLTHKDTAVIDAKGTTVRIYMSHANNKTNLKTPLTSDSLVQFFGDDTLDVRTAPVIKGLTLAAAPYCAIVVTRTDSNADTLDFKSATGVRDSSVMEFSITQEK